MTMNQDQKTGRLLPGHQINKGRVNNPRGIGTKEIRLSGRHWVRRALEIPEENWPAVPFCAADRHARKLVKELKALKGKDFVSALSTAHQDAYGQESRIEVQSTPDPLEAAAEISRIEAEINRLLKGGK